MTKKQKIIIVFIIFLAIILGLTAYILYGGKGNTLPANTSTVNQVDASQPASLIISEQTSFNKFNEAIKQAGLMAELDKEVTIFVPNNQAFNDLPDSDMIAETLDKNITGYHIVKGIFLAADLSDGQKLTTVSGRDLVVLVEDDVKYILDAKGDKVTILSPDLKTSGGVIHEIDRVFLPQ